MTGDAGALELALLLAHTRDAREASTGRIAELAGRCEPARLSAVLEERRVLALLGPRAGPVLDEPLRHARILAVAAAMRLQADGDQLIGELRGAGIHTRPLKGPWLSERAHGDPGLRASGDIDLLVDRNDLHAAVALLRTLGYDPPADRVDPTGLPLLHFRLHHPERPTVELHWRVHWHEEHFSARLLERDDPADDLAALLLFYARDGFQGLRLLADVTGWCDRHDPPPGLLDAHLREHPRLAPTWRAAAVAAARIGGAPLVAGNGALSRREQAAVRLASWSERGTPEQLAANVALVDALLAPPRSGRALLARQRDVSSGRPAVHLAKSAPRWAYALARVQRGPWDPLPS